MFNKNLIECEICLKKSNLKNIHYCPECGNDLIEQYWLMENEKVKQEMKKCEQNKELIKNYITTLPNPTNKRLYYNRLNFSIKNIFK